MKSFRILLWISVFSLFAAPARADDAIVRFVITNHGDDVGGKGKYFIYPVGERKKDLGYAYSGAQAKVPEGTYDVLVRYQDGSVKKEQWMEHKELSGTVDETVEMNVKTANVKYTLMNNGVAIGNKGRFLIYPAGTKDKEIADEPSGSTATVASGTYDVLLKFKDDSVKKEMWLKNQKLDGNFEQTVDVSLNLAEVMLHVTRLGQPSKIAWCGVYTPGDHAEPVAKGQSDEVFQVAEGTYDIGCFYNDAGLESDQWLKGQEIKGKIELKIAFDFQRSTLKVVPPPEWGSAAGSSVMLFVPGDRQRPLAKAAMGERLVFASGTYDVVMKADKRQVVWPRIALEGEVVVPFADKAPAKSLKNVTIMAPQPGPAPVQPAVPAAPNPSPAAPAAATPPPSTATPEETTRKPAEPEPEVPAGPEVVVTSEGPPPQTLPPWAVKPAKKKWFGGCSLMAR